MRIKCIFLTLLLLVTLTTAKSQSFRNTVKGNNIFAFELFKKTYSQDKNVLISPFSVSSALAMTYAGTKNETENQMRTVMHFESLQENCHQGFSGLMNHFKKINNDSTIILSIANALWKRDNIEFKSDYLNLTKKYYNASIFQLTNAEPVNSWAEKNTFGKIKKIVSDKDIKNSELVLTNAIYFKGEWSKLFKEKDTKKDSFQTAKNKNTIAEMMFQHTQVSYFEDEQNQVLELPYKGDSISMIIILPKTGSSISGLIHAFDSKWYNYYQTNLTKTEVMIYIPKFTFQSTFELSETLSESGMKDAFNSEKADFSRMSANKNLYIDKIIHKTFIEVNEKGSEAAAVTAVSVVLTSAITNTVVFKANRPFMFLISDKKTGSILFIGTLMDPSE